MRVLKEHAERKGSARVVSSSDCPRVTKVSASSKAQALVAAEDGTPSASNPTAFATVQLPAVERDNAHAALEKAQHAEPGSSSCPRRARGSVRTYRPVFNRAVFAEWLRPAALAMSGRVVWARGRTANLGCSKLCLRARVSAAICLSASSPTAFVVCQGHVVESAKEAVETLNLHQDAYLD